VKVYRLVRPTAAISPNRRNVSRSLWRFPGAPQSSAEARRGRRMNAGTGQRCIESEAPHPSDGFFGSSGQRIVRRRALLVRFATSSSPLPRKFAGQSVVRRRLPLSGPPALVFRFGVRGGCYCRARRCTGSSWEDGGQNSTTSGICPHFSLGTDIGRLRSVTVESRFAVRLGGRRAKTTRCVTLLPGQC
jgi:hypothetical protein